MAGFTNILSREMASWDTTERAGLMISPPIGLASWHTTERAGLMVPPPRGLASWDPTERAGLMIPPPRSTDSWNPIQGVGLRTPYPDGRAVDTSKRLTKSLIRLLVWNSKTINWIHNHFAKQSYGWLSQLADLFLISRRYRNVGPPEWWSCISLLLGTVVLGPTILEM